MGVSLPLPRDVNFKLQSGESEGVRLVISESGSESGARNEIVPRIVSAWSAPFGGTRGSEVEKVVQRRIRGIRGERGEVRVWEEMGNSIALHVWSVPLITYLIGGSLIDEVSRDAALACVVCFQRAVDDHAESMGALREGFQRSTTGSDGGEPQSLSIIELGTGCGVVGISLVQILRNCKVLLTDLPAAEELVSRNMSISRRVEGSSLDFQVLDWDDDDVGNDIYASVYDMIVVSDCTYNSDSLPALVKVLRKLVGTSSPDAMVLVALKRRHDSEKVFFELMEKAGFWVYEREVVLLPSLLMTAEDEVEGVEIFVFRWRDER